MGIGLRTQADKEVRLLAEGGEKMQGVYQAFIKQM
jgi:hypothetical protein